MEAWRTAITRWGDTLFELALLLTNQRASAEAATVAAVCKVFTASPDARLEHELYAALLSQQKRWRQPLRNRVLPRPLSRVEPTDRALLGLWLLRHIDGERLAAILGQSPQAVVERLAQVLARNTNIPLADLQPDREHLTLGKWLESQLGLQPLPTTHTRACARCRAAQTSWQREAATMEATLQETLKKEHLPQSCIDAIEDTLLKQQHADSRRWWQERHVVIPAFFGGIALALLVLIAPWGGAIPSLATPPTTARSLVQSTIDGWTTMPESGTIHRQVWAIDPRLQTDNPLITDLWLSAERGQYRVEVRHNNQLVEWQLADGRQTLHHAGEAAYSSCPWRTDASTTFRMLDQAALSFEATPEQQRAVREARLVQGAYGVGYRALHQALLADDLRSFGTRRDNQQSLVVLSYTDRQARPERQILLRIDPETSQLYGVQEVPLSSSQSTARDLWRLQKLDDSANSIPTHLPRWPQNISRDQIFDISCPALNPQHVVSLSTLVGDSQQWFLPQELPPGIDRAALLTLNPVVTYIDYTPLGVPRGSVATFLGRDRWLTISDLDWHPGSETMEEIERGPWLVEIGKQPRPGIWSLRLRQIQYRQNPSSPTIAIFGSGWNQEELLEVIDTLRLFDPQIWLHLDTAFIDARPLPQAVHESIRRAFTALQPAGPDDTLYSETTSVARVKPTTETLHDPYTISDTIRAPQQILRKQWLIYRDSRLAQFRDLVERADGSPHALIASDGEDFTVYLSAEGRLYTGKAGVLPMYPQQPGVEMVRSLLRTSDPIWLLDRDGAKVLEQSSRYRFVTMSFEFSGSALQHVPWTEELGEGEIVRRLWLDSQTYQPRQFTVVHRNQAGQETPLITTTLVTRRSDMPPAQSLLALTPLPDDVLMMNVTATRETTVELPATQRVSRILIWPIASHIVIGEAPPLRGSRTQLSSNGLWQQRWDRFVGSDVWHQSVYSFPPDDTEILITQGPRNLMRHILRYQSSVRSWEQSKPLEVTIAGETRTAWLLSTDTEAALVVEIDDLLMHISGPIGYLQGPLLERLPQLTWTSTQ